MAKQEPREKVPCPDCGKKFDPRGVAIHMRFAHGKVGKYAATRRVVKRRKRRVRAVSNPMDFEPASIGFMSSLIAQTCVKVAAALNVRE